MKTVAHFIGRKKSLFDDSPKAAIEVSRLSFVEGDGLKRHSRTTGIQQR
jgi:hypothetical protein